MQILNTVYISSLILGKNTDKNVIIFPPKVGQLFNSLSLILNYLSGQIHCSLLSATVFPQRHSKSVS